jgi:cold shock protein
LSEQFAGKVIWFDNKLGFGFLYWENAGKRQDDLFFHFSDILADGFRSLSKNQPVSFEVGENFHKKPKAIKIRLMLE